MKHKNINRLSHLSFFAIAVFVLALSMQASAGIVGQWLLDETSGTVAKDTSGNGNDGEIIGKANWVNGKFGKALELDGTSTGLKVAPGLALKNFTAVLWVNSGKDWGKTRTELWCGSKTYGDAVLIRGDDRADWKKGEAMLHWTDGAAWHAIGSGKLKSKTWYHLAGTFNGSTLKFYVDGKLVGQKDSKIGAGEKDTFIGCHPNPTNYFQGMIDEVAIFDDALGGVEISKIATDGFGGATPVFPADKLATKWSKIRSSN
jgi:hypothetical protein